jgi:NADH-quinone oxidoreductase subunit H
MIGEYLNIVLMCAMTTILFLGGWHAPLEIPPFIWIPDLAWFVIKIWFVFFLFAMVKAIVPRYRYDQLMRIGWKMFLPFSLLWVVVTSGYLLALDKLP